MINEGDIQRIREVLGVNTDDPKAAQAWSIGAKEALAALLDHVEESVQKDGGTFARQLRDALEARILRELNGRAELTDDVSVHSLGVHVTPEGVIVDARLKLGVWKQ